MIALVRQICQEQWRGGACAHTRAGSRLNNDSTPDFGSAAKFGNTAIGPFVPRPNNASRFRDPSRSIFPRFRRYNTHPPPLLLRFNRFAYFPSIFTLSLAPRLLPARALFSPSSSSRPGPSRSRYLTEDFVPRERERERGEEWTATKGDGGASGSRRRKKKESRKNW